MVLSESEVEIAQKQIYTWEKFEKHWPRMRWYAILISLLLASTAMIIFFSGSGMWELTEKWPVDNSDISDVKVYLDIRANGLRAEIFRYIGITIQLGLSAIIFGATVVSWNRHKYIKLKILALKELLGQKH